MRKINGVALTDKKVLKQSVRELIQKKDLNAVANSLLQLGFEEVEGKNCLVLMREDNNGDTVYTTLTMTVGTTHPLDKAQKKSKPKAKATEKQEILLED